MEKQEIELENINEDLSLSNVKVGKTIGSPDEDDEEDESEVMGASAQGSQGRQVVASPKAP